MNEPLKERVKEVFAAALDLEDAERAAYLERVCGQDEELRAAVDEILEGRGRAAGFLGSETRNENLAPVFRERQTIAGRFRVIRFRGRGGMGEVYECHDERLNLRVGLKTIRSDFAADEESRQRFAREIIVAREVSHANLCRVFDLIEHVQEDGSVTACLTMEWLEGETLQARLQRQRPLALTEAMRILRDTAQALDALHGAGIVHRDLKPGNIMLVGREGEGERAVVMDFGLAKPLQGTAEWYESTADFQAGAPYFLAPEQLRNEKLTRASDIYAFGLVMDECVTERRAFEAGSLAALYYQRLHERPIEPTRRAQGLPAAWNEAILACLETNPSDRPDSAREALAAIDSRKPAASRRRNFVPALWAAAVFLAVIGAGAAMISMQAPRLSSSLVVFPLSDLLNDASFRHLPGGLTSELVSRLSRLDGLAVKQYYKARSAAPLESIRERFHLDGDLQKYEKRVRMTLRLTDTEKANQVVWSQGFDRDMENPLEMQAEVAEKVAQALERQVFLEAPAVERARFAGSRAARSLREWLGFGPPQQMLTQSPAAYHAYLRGRQLLDERKPATLDRAIETLQGGLREDPNFSLLHSALADAQLARLDNLRGDQSAIVQLAEEAAKNAVRLNPGSPEAHVSLASVRQMQWDWKEAENEFREAIRLAPRSPVAYRRFGGMIMQFGRFDEGLAYVKRGLDLDPYDLPGQNGYGLCLIIARRYGEAEIQLQEAISQGNFMSAQGNLGFLYAEMAREARGEERERLLQLARRQEAALRSLELEGKDAAVAKAPLSDFLAALICVVAGDRAGFGRWLTRLYKIDEAEMLTPANLAMLYGVNGDLGRAQEYLRAAVRIKDRRLLYIKVLPHWEPLRATAEYQAVLSKMNL
jgi:serine/threonine protein kinase/Tfp pilus assembly protein PilF